MKSNEKSLLYRSEFLGEVFEVYIPYDWSILEIGAGDYRNINYLKEKGYTNIEGIDKKDGTAIEDVPEKQYDVIYTMSTLFLIPPENNWVFEKIANMAKKMIITVEGETTSSNGVFGRDYHEVFMPYGFKQIDHQENVFNKYGVLRVLKK